MKVYLAAQLFSRSTADALDYLREDLKVPQFAHTKLTSHICRIIDGGFDLLNTSNLVASGQKSVWRKTNLEEKSQKLNSFASFLCKIRIINSNQLLADSSRNTTVVGFLSAIKANLILAARFLQNEDDQYRPYYTQQDFLEHTFSRLRQKCGSGRMPDVVQVTLRFFNMYSRLTLTVLLLYFIQTKYIIRMLLVFQEGGIDPSVYGNCKFLRSDEEDIEEDEVSVASRSIVVVNSKIQSQDEAFLIEMAGDDSTTPPSDDVLYKEHCLVYVEGYLVKQLERQKICATCRKALVNNPLDSLPEKLKILINRKNRNGKLKVPSNSFHLLISAAEKIFQDFIIKKKISWNTPHLHKVLAAKVI